MNGKLEGVTMDVLCGTPWLVADIGGTNARFGWVQSASQGVERVKTLPVATHAGPASAVRSYLAAVQQELGDAFELPRHAAFAIATSIVGDVVEMTNSHWRFSRSQLRAELGFESLTILNDFEALALSLPGLRPEQLRVRGKAPLPHGTLAVIGPGTGLGVGGVMETPHGWLAISGEGGHATLAAGDDFESEVLAHVRREFEHVSGERLLSGIGLPVLHRAVAGVLGTAAEHLTSEVIMQRGLARADIACSRTLDTFCALLGGFAGNVALTLGARGGVYIGGGIVPRMGERFFESDFRRRFEAKGRFRAYLEPIPTPLIVDTLAALGGAALSIEQAGR